MCYIPGFGLPQSSYEIVADLHRAIFLRERVHKLLVIILVLPFLQLVIRQIKKKHCSQQVCYDFETIKLQTKPRDIAHNIYISIYKHTLLFIHGKLYNYLIVSISNMVLTRQNSFISNKLNISFKLAVNIYFPLETNKNTKQAILPFCFQLITILSIVCVCIIYRA